MTLRFAANLSLMFAEVPFLDRFAAARRAGFRCVEFQFPYAFPEAEVEARLKDNGLEVALFNLPPGDFDKGERGIACHPGREDEFRRGVDTMLSYAERLDCKKINCLAGIKPEGLSRDAALDVLAGNLSYAAERLAAQGMMLLAEPINPYDIPGFLVNRSAEGIAMIDRVGAANFALQYDVYHMQRVEGELTSTLSKLMERIGHIQIADAPLRHEPGTGEINYGHILGHIEALGYDGWVGCEYKPKAGTVEGLSWIKELGFAL